MHQPIRKIIPGLIVSLVWGYLCCACLQAQQFNFTRFNVEDGLSQAQVMSICQDRRGYLWMATYGGGVSRYDGREFVNFTSEDGLLSNMVNDVVEDRHGVLWFSHLGQGLCRYDGYEFKCLGEQDGLFMTDRADLFEDASGNMWVLTIGNGAYRWDGERFEHFTRENGLPGDTVYAAAITGDDLLWFATSNGLCSYDGNLFRNHTSYNESSNHVVNALTVDKKGRLWLSHREGISTFENNTFRPVPGTNRLVPTIIKMLYADSRDRVWVVTEQGLKRISKWKVFDFEGQEGLWNGIINCVFEDGSGNIWVGTNGDGASRFTNERFVHYNSFPSSGLVFSIARQPNGDYWIGTGEGVYVFDGKEFRLLTGEKVLESGYIMNLMLDQQGNTWISSFSGLYRNDGETTTLVPLRKGKEDPIVLSTFEDRKGDIWIASKIGFFVYRDDSIIDLGMQNEEFNTYGLQVREDSRGGKWMVTGKQGVIYYNGKTARSFTEKDGLQSNQVRNVAIDRNGRVWFGTYEGLCRYDGKGFCYISTLQNPALKVIYFLQTDEEGNLWAGTSKGLIKLTLDKDSNPMSLKLYGTEEGFRGPECNLNSAFKDNDGRLWFGNIAGLTVYNPQEDKKQADLPKVGITGLKIFLEDVDWASRNVDSITPWNHLPVDLKLPYHQNHLRFSFIGVETSLPERIRYKYMLEGLDDDWLPLTDETHATYSSLPPGDYIFKVVAMNGDGNITATPSSYSFTISTPIWQRTWFYAVATLLILGLILLLFNIRTRNLRKQRERLQMEVDERTQELRLEKEKVEAANLAKSEFLATMSHEIRTPLNGVIGMTDLLMASEMPSEQKNCVKNIRLSGESLLAVINDILDFSKIEAGKLELESLPVSLNQVMEEVMEMLAFGAHTKNLDMLFKIDSSVPASISTDHPRLRQVLLNLVGNAIKFTDKGEIMISVSAKPLSESKQRLNFSVRDTGIGIPDDKIDQLFESFTQADSSTTRKYGGTGLGLAICYKLIDMMGGEIWVESKLNSGTTFHFNLDVDVHENDPVPEELSGMHMVIASPHQPTLDTLNAYCESWGIWVKTATNVDSLASILERARGFDHLVVDARMLDAELGMIRELRLRFDPEELPVTLLCLPEDAVELSKHRSMGLNFLLRPLKPMRLIPLLLEEETTESLVDQHKSKFAEQTEEIEPLAERIPLNILVAEDNAINQQVALGMLKRMGYTADIAGHGLEAIEMVRKKKYDIVFMDVQMPHMDGIEATQHIIKEMAEKRPRIIAMTANAMQGDRERYLAAGMDGYVSKPILLKEVHDLLETFAPDTPKIKVEDKQKNGTPAPKTSKQAPAKKEKNGHSKSPVEAEVKNQYINLSNLLELSGGDKQFIEGVLGMIVEKMPDSIQEMSTYYAEEEFDALKKAAHSLKSSSGYTGSEELKDLFQRIESLAGSRNETHRIPDLITQVIDLGEKVVVELNRELNRN